MALSGGRSRSPRLLVVMLVAASLITITVDYREQNSGPLATAGRAALAVIAPMQEAVSKVTHPIGNFFSTLVRLPEIRAENERLRNEVSNLRSRLDVIGNESARLRELEDILHVKRSLGPATDSVAAQVIASGVSNLEWTINIDKGSEAGIRLDDAVVVGDSTGARLVGHVVRVTGNASIVQLVIDPDSFVAARLETAQATGLVQGNGTQDMQMHLLSTSTEVTAGDEVATAGFKISGVGQSQYPPNVLIGTVARVLKSDTATEKYVTVLPAVDFSSLDIVLVVLSHGAG
ncbi:MAG: rod shape-determining protein MreC [Actinomycetota bacterium]